MTEYLFNLLCKLVGNPSSIGSIGWTKWEEETKSKHPIKYFLLETVPTFISSNWKWWISDPIYHLNCKYIKKYHHIKIDVDRFRHHHKASIRNYYWFDSDEQILYATFQILVDFMEEEADADNPFAASAMYCHGYDVYGDYSGKGPFIFTAKVWLRK